MAGEGMDCEEIGPNTDQSICQSHPCKQGSVTWPTAEQMAVEKHGDRSAENVAKVLTQAGLSLR